MRWPTRYHCDWYMNERNEWHTILCTFFGKSWTRRYDVRGASELSRTIWCEQKSVNHLLLKYLYCNSHCGIQVINQTKQMSSSAMMFVVRPMQPIAWKWTICLCIQSVLRWKSSAQNYRHIYSDKNVDSMPFNRKRNWTSNMWCVCLTGPASALLFNHERQQWNILNSVENEVDCLLSIRKLLLLDAFCWMKRRSVKKEGERREGAR